MKTISSGAQTAIASGQVYMALLVKIAFAGGATVGYTTANLDLVWDGLTYQGAYGLGSIGPITDQAGELQGMQFDVRANDAAAIGIALDAGDQWQGSAVSLMVAIITHDPVTGYTVQDAAVEWTGYGDTFTTRESSEGAILVATCESSMIDLLRGYPLTYSDADQQMISATDRFYEFVAAQVDAPVVWPAKDWFYK